MWLKKDKIFFNLNTNNVTSIYIEVGVNADREPVYYIVAEMTYDHPGSSHIVKVIIACLSDEQESEHYLDVVVRLIQQDDLIVDDLTQCINAYGEQ